MTRFTVMTIIILLLPGCSKKHPVYRAAPPFELTQGAPDYSNLSQWAAHPWKTDPSDSFPTPLKNEIRDTIADVFFIHPTTYTGNRSGWNADLNDSVLNAKTDYSSILYQASVFNQHCRVFAPRYRQGHFSAFFIDTLESKPIFDSAYSDVKSAFEYFLKFHHQGRPLLIAGHSQGAYLAERLLKEYFDGKLLHNKLVAAYIVGWPVPKNLFEKIPVCADSVQTRCFCGWRTFRQDYLPEYILKEVPGSFITNPLSWDTSSKYISRMQNPGSVLRDFDKVIYHTTDAQINNGILWVNKPKFPGSVFYHARNYHIADINLFYISMRNNIETRIRNFLKQDHAGH